MRHRWPATVRPLADGEPTVPGGFVHRIDPVLGTVAGVHLWWYGAGFAAGFLAIHRAAMRARKNLAMTRHDVWSLSIAMALGTLAIVGRVTDVWWAVKCPYAESVRHPVVLYDGLKNLVLAGYLLGAGLLWRSRQRRLGRLRPAWRPPPAGAQSADLPPSAWQRAAFAALLAACLTIPSNWTQDVPRRYGGRHPGLEHSWLYPTLDWSPP